MKKLALVSLLSLSIVAGYAIAGECCSTSYKCPSTCNTSTCKMRSGDRCTSCGCETKTETPDEEIAKRHAKIMEIADECNEITVSIDMKNAGADEATWHEAVEVVKEWGKDLAHTLRTKTPGVELDVKIAGFTCYKGSKLETE